jgi:hypothetical protein
MHGVKSRIIEGVAVRDGSFSWWLQLQRWPALSSSQSRYQPPRAKKQRVSCLRIYENQRIARTGHTDTTHNPANISTPGDTASTG